MLDLSAVGKWVMVIGLGLVLLGGLVWLAGRAGLPVGRLPGDIRIERGGLSVYVPCATSIILSIVLTIGLNLVLRLLSRR